MAYKQIILEGAQEDYEGILRYLRINLGSLGAALGFMDAYEKKVRLLLDFPEMYPLSAFPELAELGYRYFLVKRYVVLYKVIKTTVFVAHIFHTSQDYMRLVVEEDARVFESIGAPE